MDAAAEWRSRLTIATCGALLFLTLTGLSIYLLPFSVFNQISVLTHTIIGLVFIVPMVWYTWRHWKVRRKGNLSHYQLLGYVGAGLLALCIFSGVVVTWQGLVGPRMTEGWKLIHLLTGIALPVVLVIHLATVIVRKVNNLQSQATLRRARRVFYVGSAATCGVMFALTLAWSRTYNEPPIYEAFPVDYNWHFGHDRPYAPSLARIDHGHFGSWQDSVQQRVLEVIDAKDHHVYLAAYRTVEKEPIGLFAQIRHGLSAIGATDDQMRRVEAIFDDASEWMRNHGAINPSALAGSDRCGTCHTQIYEEWQPSAHRYSSMDDMFQIVQEIMAVETSAEHTRYCAGCHDPISLFAGAKTSSNITLSAEGWHEGISCITCHSITQADVQGNADFAIQPPRRYVYELSDHPAAIVASDFLIRTYPDHHIRSYSRPLYKTAEYCGACHKQYMDTDLNTDIGRVQGQNQYDSWLYSRWHVEGNPQQTVNCRECHMPLIASTDPAAGDLTDYNRSPRDGMHRSHRFLGANQYIPILHELEGGEEQVRLTEQWLRGEIDIPEIAHKWTTGPVVRMDFNAPEQINRGEEFTFQLVLINNKTGHDFPTGPLDMIESWIELVVTDDHGNVLHHTGHLDERDSVIDPIVWFKADGFDREGEFIDRHNLWDLVGKSYSRSLFPGMTDTAEVPLQCPSMARGRLSPGLDERDVPGQRMATYSLPAGSDYAGTLHIEAILWYRKANPEFLDRVYGVEAGVRSPITEMNRVSTTIEVLPDGVASPQ